MAYFLDKKAFKYYAPKEVHPHFENFKNYLENLTKNSSLAKSLVKRHDIPFPCHYGFPIVHLVALYKNQKWNYFSVPFDHYKKKDKHRVVDQSGKQDVPCFMPHLRLEVVSDPALTKVFDYDIAKRICEDGMIFHGSELEKEMTVETKLTRKPAILFTAPMSMMLKRSSNKFLNQKYTLYQHIFGAGNEYPDDGVFYIGITSREWKRRWAEHRAAIKRGSQLKFHRVYRSRENEKRLTYVHHKIMCVAPSLDLVQDLEEGFVSAHWDDERILNMIPGGKAGIKHLQKHKIIKDGSLKFLPKYIEKTQENSLNNFSEKGGVAPWISEAWQNDDYAVSVICGSDDRLSREQVLSIRSHAGTGLSPREILEIVGAKNVNQVENVINEKTYTRIK